MHSYIVLDYADVHSHAHHACVVCLWEEVLYQLAHYPERLLLCELHQDQEVYYKVHALTVPHVWVSHRQVSQYRR